MKVYNFLKAYIGPAYTGLASLCSILGLVLMFINSKTACIVALCVICLGFAALIWGILRGINRVILDNSEKDYKSIYTSYIYQSKDGIKSTLDTYRMIQCKRLFLTDIHFNFKWTGTKMPVLSSKTQTIENVSHNDNCNKWDEAVVKFNRPLRYNECTVMNIKSDHDDVDNTAKPWLSCKLVNPIEMITYHVMLFHIKRMVIMNLLFLSVRKLIWMLMAILNIIESVAFDGGNKVYSFSIVNPEPGYIYRLRWEK